MPKASINAITEKCQKSMENAKEYFLEYRGLDGVCLLIQLYTDNPKRGKGFVNVAVKRTGVSETKNTGSVRHVFEEKGLILAAAKIGNKKISLADAEEHAIEAEAEEVEHLGDNIQFLCDPKELHSVKTRLQEFGYDIESSELEFLPRSPIELDENGMQALAAIIERIEDIEDVLKVYPNIV
uniref:Transcriptional regulatory protein FMG_0893 n=2 Tax=Hirondellea gigas TaxID=1518452 RepID=A0A6A7FWJ6_9CRUS